MKTRYLYYIIIIFSAGLLAGNAYGQKYWNTAAKVSGSKYVAVNSYTSLDNLSGSFTVECWFNAPVSGAATLVGKNGVRLLLEAENGMVRGRVQTNNNSKLRTRYTNLFSLNTWYHLACTYDSTSDAIRFYVNGYLDTSGTTANGPIPGTDSIFIGNSGYGQSEVMVDDIRIWDYARTSAEIRDNVRLPFGGIIQPSGPLLMHAAFDNTSSGPFYPSLNLYDGYNQYYNRGGEAVDIGKNPSTTLFTNSALKVDGAGDYARMRTDPDVELTGPMTIEMWINPDTADVNQRYILAKKGGWNDPGYAVYYQNGKIRIKTNGSGSYTVSDIPVKKWTHYAVAIGSSNSYVYINGKLDHEAGVGLPLANTDSLYIGGFPLDNGYFKGYVDAVKISNYQKTQAEVQNSMFEMTDNTNNPSPPYSTVSFNFDYNCAYNQYSPVNGTTYFLLGNAFITKPNAVDNTPASPVIAPNVPGFPEGYSIKAGDRRIPEFNSAGFMKEDSVYFPALVTISDLNLFLNINHENHYDLVIKLFSPAGDSITVWNNDGGAGTGDHIITVFDDQADSALYYSYVDFGPRIKPPQSLNSKFSGENAKGYWRIKITDLYNGNIGYLYGWGIQVNSQVLVGSENISSEIPGDYKLEQNYPNPFNPVTNIKFSIAKAGLVKLTIYDILGKEVAVLVNRELTAGTYNEAFDGSRLSSGIYFYKLQTDRFTEVKRMALVK